MMRYALADNENWTDDYTITHRKTVHLVPDDVDPTALCGVIVSVTLRYSRRDRTAIRDLRDCGNCARCQ